MPFARPSRRPFCALTVLFLTLAGPAPAQEDDSALVRIAFLKQLVDRPPALSNLDEASDDIGVSGGQLAIRDNNTTGRFIKQRFELDVSVVPADGDPVLAFAQLVADGHRLIITDLRVDTLLSIADRSDAKDVLIFNASASDDRLRNADCQPNLLHTTPSRAMLADALAQYLAWKRWSRWFLVVGRREEDRLFAAAIRRAANRFGAKIVEEKEWTYGPDARRTAQSQVPVFTQGIDYDVLMVADEIGEFGEYLAYRTWEPRPVAGTQGLVPTPWHRTHEQWGSVQLQNRFRETYGRWMAPVDYAVWMAVRSIGEAATRTGSADLASLAGYIRSDKFELAAFKGRKLTYRDWNGQLRQPILLAAPRSLVAVSPQKGFLHQVSELDTLGYDRPESGCKRK
ncbi:MAG: ABC transporter substrate-binding protein [Alphaproteobacteria bacterium]|nr:ABC transporter substrate-binding protein [Alphaproteobacteria bacterium]